MIKSLLRTTLYAGAAYGFYTIARQFFPEQIDSAVKSAKSYGNDAVKTISEQGNKLLAQGKDMAKDFTSDAKSEVKHASNSVNANRRAV